MQERKNQVRRNRPVAKSRGRRKESPKKSLLGSPIKKVTPRARKLLKRGVKVVEQGVQVISRRAESIGNTVMKRLRSS